MLLRYRSGSCYLCSSPPRPHGNEGVAGEAPWRGGLCFFSWFGGEVGGEQEGGGSESLRAPRSLNAARSGPARQDEGSVCGFLNDDGARKRLIASFNQEATATCICLAALQEPVLPLPRREEAQRWSRGARRRERSRVVARR
ncbi:hypothetical protein SKAU_G00382360 [Synaphobranchus kaupii]|uniref:Uncharacterized protein n=1 Tax=Synaphobranchus kaupii TaxID=118154 RepID=A0A9Q1EE17_SYNKA|nr:hypothetical protein SKAU_G00382360 [Synaphobranchus kaupii]